MHAAQPHRYTAHVVIIAAPFSRAPDASVPARAPSSACPHLQMTLFRGGATVGMEEFIALATSTGMPRSAANVCTAIEVGFSIGLIHLQPL